MELNESEKLKEVRENLIAHAKKSALYKNVEATNGHIVFGRGSDEAKVLFIGEAPGFSENKEGKPFVGRSGKLLGGWVKELCLSEADYAVMNVVPIIPLTSEGKIRAPTEDEINYFLPLTKKMMEKIAPKIIVPLGRSAGSIFSKSLALGEVKRYDGYKLFFIYHPAYYLRNGADGINDLRNLKKLLKEIENEEGSKKQLTLDKF
ncbi:MAG: uracil-DNA glycosylase [Candidatus Diapherotrites archaeon]|nr:uracil-DNA glycosylase [Candidatus Diapherotrites archaeon]